MPPEKDITRLPPGPPESHISSSEDDDTTRQDLEERNSPSSGGDTTQHESAYASAFSDAVAAQQDGGGGAAQGFGNVAYLATVASAALFGSTGGLSRATTVNQDELDLIADCQAESKRKYGRHKHRKLLKPMHELEKLDQRIMEIGQGEDDFVAMMAAKITEFGVKMPTIRVDYSGLTVETDAVIGSAGLPTVGNALTNMLKMFLLIKPHRQNFKILNDIKGVLLPCRATLLLGPPSSGKTTYLKVLAGQYKDSKALKISGALHYNGQEQKDFVVERTAGFISQNDVHIPSLTVMETLEFAFQCQNGTGANGFYLPTELAKAYETTMAGREKGGSPGAPVTHDTSKSMAARQKLTDEQFIQLMHDAINSGSKTLTIMRAFGIAHTKNTPIGDAMLRGVSGGERKRVTTAEIIVGPKRLLLCDEISTGLDSATLHAIIQLLCRICRGLHLTSVISLLQPPPEVFDLFDDLILMADNQIVYHGPIADVVPFFSALGFDVPPRKDVPSFLQEVTTPSGQLEFSSPALRERCGVPPGPPAHDAEPPREFMVPVSEMVDAFWKSPHGLDMQALLDKPFDPALGHPQALVKQPYALRAFEAFWIVMRRQTLQITRDSALIKGRLVQALVLGFIIGSLFYKMPVTVDNSRSYFGALFMHVVFVAMGQMPSLATTIATKAVWFKYRDSKFYHASSHAFACTFASVPTTMVDVALYTIIVYFLNGFYSGAGEFFTFYLVLVCFGISTSTVFRLVGHCAPDGVSANAYGGLVLLIMVVMSGFTIVRGSVPHWWIWAYYMSPIAWAMRALVINEFLSPNWDFYMAGNTETVGVQSLLSFDFYIDRLWIWAAVGYMLGAALFCTVLSSFALEYFSGVARVARVADEEELMQAREDAAMRRAGSAALPPAAGDPSALRAPSARSVRSRASGLSDASPSTSITIQRSGSQITRRSVAVTAAQVLGPSREMSLAAPPSTSSSIPFEPISLVFQNLRYFVPNPSYTGRKGRKKAPAAAVKQADNASSAHSSGAAGKGDVRLDLEMGVPSGPGPVSEGASKPEVVFEEEVPEQLELLKGITGFAEPRVLMALMGGSGAGKTTLMDCIAGRKTVGRIEGDIMINGHPKEQTTWSRVCGYVEQMDIHTPAMTVIEALQFSARLRLPASVSNSQAKLYVEEVMQIVDMTDQQFDLTGTPGQTGLSVEQRKRLTIAVELVANPSVVFMDEPTSGLDARAAAVVIRAVRNVARNNRSVMVTIHQPSIEIFEAFDFLLLLQRGGRTTYFGPLGHHSRNLVAYLQAVPGCSTIPAGANPATWMLEVTGGALAVVGKAVQADWPQLYKDSDLAATNERYAQDLVERLAATMQPLKVSGRYAASLAVQYGQLMNKFRAAYWRTPSYNFTRMLVTVMVALFYGSVYYKAAVLPAVASLVQVQNIMGVIYSSTSFMGMTSMMAVMPFMGMERVVFYREQASSMYSPWMFGLVTAIVDLPYLFVQVTLFVCIAYPMIGYINSAEHFFFYYLITLESILMYSTLGCALVFITPTQQLAQVVGSGFNFLMNIMNGFVITYPSIPVYYQWANRLAPTTWILYALGGDQLAGLDAPFSDRAVSTATTVGQYVTKDFGYTYSFRFYCIAIVLAWIVFLRACSVLGLRYMNFLKR